MDDEDVDFMGLGSDTIGLDNLSTSKSVTEMGVVASILNTVIVSMMLLRFREYLGETVETHGCQ
jgi:hypothetical protein